MGTTHEDGGYSADVRIELISGRKVYRVAEIGDGMMTLQPYDPPPPDGEAQLLVAIDGVAELSEVVVMHCGPSHWSDINFPEFRYTRPQRPPAEDKTNG